MKAPNNDALEAASLKLCYLIAMLDVLALSDHEGVAPKGLANFCNHAWELAIEAKSLVDGGQA